MRKSTGIRICRNGSASCAVALRVTRMKKTPEPSWKGTSADCQQGTVVGNEVHDRMPVILDPDSYDLWLDPGMRDVGAASETVEALRCSADAVLCGEQSGNHMANDDPECSAPVELVEVQNRLFS